MSKKTKSNPAAEGRGVIDGNKAYTINAFCRQLGLSRKGSSFEKLREAGLPVILGKYIRGRDFIDVLGQILETEQQVTENESAERAEQRAEE